MLKIIEKLSALAEEGVEVKILGKNKFSVGGFYKSGSVEVDCNNLTITARYDEVTEFDEDSLFEDLIRLNYKWWDRSKTRSDGWSCPAQGWDKFLVERGYVTKREEAVVIYE